MSAISSFKKLKIKAISIFIFMASIGCAQAEPCQMPTFELAKMYIGYNITVATLLTIIVLLIILRQHEQKILKQIKLKNNQINIALESTTMGLWEWNINTGMFSADKHCIEMLGYSTDEVPCDFIWWSEQTHPDDRKEVKESLMSMFSGQTKTHRSEYRIRTKDGQWLWILDRAKIIEWANSEKPAKAIGTHVDITELHKNANNLNRLATVIEHASETIIVTDCKGAIEYVNPSFETKLGYTKDNMIGKYPKILQSGKHNKAFYKNMRNDLEQGRLWQGQLVNKCKNGSIIKLETTISPIKDNHGKTIQYIAIGRDSTHESLLESQLRQSQKMEAIGTLAGGIAHDFNNILSAVIGYSELAMLDTDPASTAHHNMTEVFKAAKRAADLVSQILTFSRRTEHERKPLLLAPVIKEALKLLRGTLPTTIDIRQNIEKDCDPVLADPTQMHQIIMNLCTNAYHAMREKGGILEIRLNTIELQHEKETGQLTLAPGKYTHFSVSDTGTGMSPDLIEHIFEPYFTTKKGGDGTGLGLATVHGIVKLHDGAITVYSKPGKGTTFNIFLPTCKLKTNSDTNTKHIDQLPQGNNELIMVVDDEESIAQVVEIALRHIGYNIEAFTSGVNALEAFEAGPERFACVITDQTMPSMTGSDLAKRILAKRPDLPIILCSGFSETINEEKAHDLGIFQYLMKPVTTHVLAESVHNAIASNTT